MKNVTFNFLGVIVINQSIKFFTIFLLVFNVFAGGDDRDKEYYENLDQELAAFEAQLADDLANEAALEAAAAKVKEEPCVSYLGITSSGHYVKMIHNGIEYAIMQLISENYHVLKYGLKRSNDEIHKIFKSWNEGLLESYLVEISRDIFKAKESEKGRDLFPP